jgi:cytochrome c-type biogenesis protein CcmE
MADLSWEKRAQAAGKAATAAEAARSKFALMGFGIVFAMAMLLLIGTLTSGRFFITVSEVLDRPELMGKTVKITGAVIGESIYFDPNDKTINFTVANVTDDIGEIERAGGLAKVLYLAVNNPDSPRLKVVVRNQPMPDLLQNEAQAILTGKLGADGIFYADDLQLKCPSKYEGDLPLQTGATAG